MPRIFVVDLAIARSSLYTIDTADIIREGLCRYELSEAATGIMEKGLGRRYVPGISKSGLAALATPGIYIKIGWTDGERIFSASLGTDWWYVHRIFLLRR